MTIVTVTWGKYRVYPVVKGETQRHRRLFWADTVALLGEHPIHESNGPLTAQNKPVTTNPAPTKKVIESRLHEDTYELLPGTQIILWVDRGDERGRLAQFPAHLVCVVVDEPLSEANTIHDPYGSIGPVKLQRVEFRAAHWFLSRLPEQVSLPPIQVIGPFSSLPPVVTTGTAPLTTPPSTSTTP